MDKRNRPDWTIWLPHHIWSRFRLNCPNSMLAHATRRSLPDWPSFVYLFGAQFQQVGKCWKLEGLGRQQHLPYPENSDLQWLAPAGWQVRRVPKLKVIIRLLFSPGIKWHNIESQPTHWMYLYSTSNCKVGSNVPTVLTYNHWGQCVYVYMCVYRCNIM